MAIILREGSVISFSAMSDDFDENRGEFTLLAPSKSLLLSDALRALNGALEGIRRTCPDFQFHFKDIFIKPEDVVSNYKTRPRGKYCPSMDLSYSWLAAGFTLAAQDYLFTRYGTNKRNVTLALISVGFVLDYDQNEQMHFRLGLPREELYHKCYLA
ncbi:hypothetical protein [Ewingella americana]|uniref:Uncharacterized protein n=1 Tax=Ewingella americana TaxID=41202 RepID=A0A502GEE6_9GAMM|nr:hypothetical protein [Ewingella americana]TPG60111.1 hypothetical protein EAH77_16210 [Ewingella americana]